MKHKIIITVFLLFCFQISTLDLQAQQPEYKMEFGATLGAGGRFSRTVYERLLPAGSGLLRYNFDKRWALRLDAGMFGVKSEYLRPNEKEQKKHVNQLLLSDLVAEFNWFDFEDNPFNRSARRVTPYIFGGVGLMYFPYEGVGEIQPSVPVGLGLKIKIAYRWNMNIQYVHHFTFTDKVEGVYEMSDIYKVKGTNFLNKDMLSALTVGLTFDFLKSNSHCHCQRNQEY